MANVIDSISIKGMKHSDFAQLSEIFHHHKEDGTYWGRKDYWDERMVRLTKWLDAVETATRESKISC